MQKLKQTILLCLLCTISMVAYADEIPNDEIWYTSTDGSVVTPNKSNVFGTNILSNTYDDGKGIIKFDGDVTSIGSDAFYLSSGLTSITIPSSVTSIGGSAFYGCSFLTSAMIPESVTSIGIRAFYDCSRLTSAMIPESVTSIGESAFSHCSSLTSVTIPNSVTSIENGVFSGCSSLTSISIPNSVTIIGRGAFGNCSRLTSVTIPNSVTSIGESAFIFCGSLTSISIPNSVTSIGSGAFENCRITSVYVDDMESFFKIQMEDENSNPFSRNQWMQYQNKNINVYYSDGTLVDKVEIPVEITDDWEAHQFALLYLPFEEIHIKSSSVPSIQNIHTNDFSTIVVPSQSLEAYRSAPVWKGFYQRIVPDDAQLKMSVNAKAEREGSGLYSAAGEKALSYVTDLTIEGAINSYDFMVFRNKMPNLHRLDLTGTTIEANPYEFYTGCYTEENRLPEYAFHEQTKLLEVKLPNTITYIGSHAFQGCPNLRDVQLHEGITTIGEYAFNKCTALPYIEIPTGVAVIGDRAFQECSSLEEVRLNEGLLKMGDEVFSLATLLKSINLPLSLQEIGRSCFYSCSLESVTVPGNVRTLPDRTFASNKNLRTVTLPSRLRSIEDNAFAGCVSLQEIRIPPMVETIGNSAFSSCDELSDVYVYLANAKDLKINQGTFGRWTTALLHVPNFARNSYYWDTQWSQFVNVTEFDEPYETFYTNNDMLLDSESGTIEGTPDATFLAEAGLTVDGVTQVLDEIELNNDGDKSSSLIPTGGGAITAKSARIVIKVTAKKWHFFCFPFDIPLDRTEYDGESIWRQYDGAARSRSQGGWQNLASGTTHLDAGRGYIFFGNKTGNLVLNVENPAISSDDVATTLEQYSSNSPQDASWNMVGNPYLSYYNIDALAYESPITVWTGNGYEAYRPGDDDYEFYPYQAFFVQATDEGSEIGYDAQARETYNGSLTTLAKARKLRAMKATDPDRLFINLELTGNGGETYLDKTRVVFNGRASADYELKCDAGKFFSAERNAEIYTIDSRNAEYSINERPVGDGTVALGVQVNVAGTYTISAQRMDVRMILTDHELGTDHDLSAGGYEFSMGKGRSDSRFTLRIASEETSIEEMASRTGMEISLEDGISIGNIADDASVRVYTLSGTPVATMTGSGTIPVQKGMYVLTIGNYSSKIAVK